MSMIEDISIHISQLRKAANLLAFLHDIPPVDETTSNLSQMSEIAAYKAVSSAAESLARADFPGASRFQHVYSQLLSEFYTPVDESEDGFGLSLLHGDRAKNLRPTVIYILDSFLAQLPRPPEGAIGGGPDRKPPRNAFLNLVCHIHRGVSTIKQVIFTDPYLLVDKGEDSSGGGYEGAIDFLMALGLTKDDSFDLKVTPAPKKASTDAFGIFQRHIQATFPKAKLSRFSSSCQFHDRLYLTRDSKNRLRGVFGPSINGLDSKSIVIMGAIEGKDLEMLSHWL